MDPQQIVAWLAPIAASLATFAGQRALTSRFEKADEKREMARLETSEKRAAEAEWRERIESRMDTQDGKIDALVVAQASTMRSDVIHKCHRYLDDLGCASTAEKQALNSQWRDYSHLCETHDIENSFVDGLVEQVMALPSRPTKEE